jgi:hypothetical protein
MARESSQKVRWDWYFWGSSSSWIDFVILWLMQARIRAGKVRAHLAGRGDEAQGVAQIALALFQSQSTTDGSRAEAVDRPTGQAPLPQNHCRTAQLRREMFFHQLQGENKISFVFIHFLKFIFP